MDTNLTQITDIIKRASENATLKKIVFSKSRDKSIVKATAIILSGKSGTFFQLESFSSDNKAFHKNIPLDDAPDMLAKISLEGFMQTNILTSAGDCEIKISKSGAVYIGNKIKTDGIKITPLSHNRQKHYILDKYLSEPFLYKLGITDKNGRIHDKMQAKYRQINRFIEIVNDMSDALKENDSILVYDLCCGKSYLSFALYFYLEKILGLSVEMIGADLKSDVVEYCNSTARACGMQGLKFLCGDIATIGLDRPADMVVSLHACDIATDIVLAHAIRSGAKTVLSTPCCHKELFSKIKEISEDTRKNLSFVLEHSMSAQKLCENLTDSLRAKTLEAYGYDVDMIELVTPDDTPKNLLIRAIKRHSKQDTEKMSELEKARTTIGAVLTLENLLK
ncbi:MAG: SAM-dependent methyltransferase [Ruminococcaceae bacterium]|nr:SAM-dependent methyltransferase [Oscillospiraceae bacterium]